MAALAGAQPMTIRLLAFAAGIALLRASALAQSAAPSPSPSQTPEPCKTVVFPIVGTHIPGSLTGRPGLVLSGGGFTSMPHAPVFAFLRAHLENRRGRAGNLVILKASGARDYSEEFYGESRLASIQEILISPCTPRAQVDRAAAYVDRADAVLFAGGDQANYVRWKGSKLIDAVKRLYARGGVVGGGSAGLAIQGAIVYDSVAADRVLPSDQNVATPDALANPFERAISFTTGFFAWPALRDTITDSHVARRDRFGRLAAFMARALHEGLSSGSPIYGLAVDEASVLIVDEHGLATLYTTREADGYRSLGVWILAGKAAGRLAPAMPLRYTVEVTRLARTGQQYNLITKHGSGGRYRVTVDGSSRRRYSRNPYVP